MLSRALIVLLVVLNLGVASWWALRPAAPAPSSSSPAPGIARLQLLEDAKPARAPPRASAVASASSAIAAPAAAATTVPAAGAASRCFSFGPFVEAATLAAARTALQPHAQRLVVRQAPAATRGWRVWIPPLPDRAAAVAMAARIGAAGFNDYYIFAEGDERNAIALGRFGNEDAARRRQQALQQAGFAAQAEGIASGKATVQWLDVVAGPAFDADALRAAAAAPQARSTPCTTAR